MKKTLLAVIVLFAQYSYGQTSATEKNIEQITLKARKKVNQERNEFAKMLKRQKFYQMKILIEIILRL